MDDVSTISYAKVPYGEIFPCTYHLKIGYNHLIIEALRSSSILNSIFRNYSSIGSIFLCMATRTAYEQEVLTRIEEGDENDPIDINRYRFSTTTFAQLTDAQRIKIIHRILKRNDFMDTLYWLLMHILPLIKEQRIPIFCVHLKKIMGHFNDAMNWKPLPPYVVDNVTMTSPQLPCIENVGNRFKKAVEEYVVEEVDLHTLMSFLLDENIGEYGDDILRIVSRRVVPPPREILLSEITGSRRSGGGA